MGDTKPVFKLVAGHVALDFANTLDNRFDSPNTIELLDSYGSYLEFCEQIGVISSAEVRILQRLGTRERSSALRRAQAFREGLERIFSAVVSHQGAPQADVESLEKLVKKALSQQRLKERQGTFSWEREPDRDAEAPLRQIALAASALLTSDDLRFVKECQSTTCRWLFLDISKNHSRRWCDMQICGNRSKARRYYGTHSDRP